MHSRTKLQESTPGSLPTKKANSNNTLSTNGHQAVELTAKNPIALPCLRAGSRGAWVMIFTQSQIHILLNATGILNSWSWQLWQIQQFGGSLTYLQVLCFRSCLCSKRQKHSQNSAAYPATSDQGSSRLVSWPEVGDEILGGLCSVEF